MTSSPIGKKLRRMGMGAVLFALILIGLAAAFPGASPPAVALIVLGALFSLAFGIFGEPLRFVLWRDGGRAGVWLSYFVSVVCVAMALCLAWVLHTWPLVHTAA